MKGFDLIIRELHRAIRRIRDGADRRRAILELVRMPDRLLADLGIDRGRIPEIVDGLIAQREATRATSGTPLPPDPSVDTISGGPIARAPA